MKLDSDQQTVLEDIVFHEGAEILMLVAEDLAKGVEQRVLSLSTIDVDKDRLFVEKARAEGARQLAAGLRRRVEQIKQERLEALDS